LEKSGKVLNNQEKVWKKQEKVWVWQNRMSGRARCEHPLPAGTP